MRKTLLATLLIAGTTLGFAKNNVEPETTVKLQDNKIEVKETKEVKEENDDSARKLCASIYHYTTQSVSSDMYGNIYSQTIHHYVQQSYWCGDNEPRTTFVEGTPP
ncbi:hypothetical protein [uncultured Chryseobacterium sp.]|uniref:hypothetical protein n=1 Tax=uncultured Chryseobacterium sp. TaxID=259322 RepID=UPI0037494D68